MPTTNLCELQFPFRCWFGADVVAGRSLPSAAPVFSVQLRPLRAVSVEPLTLRVWQVGRVSTLVAVGRSSVLFSHREKRASMATALHFVELLRWVYNVNPESGLDRPTVTEKCLVSEFTLGRGRRGLTRIRTFVDPTSGRTAIENPHGPRGGRLVWSPSLLVGMWFLGHDCLSKAIAKPTPHAKADMSRPRGVVLEEVANDGHRRWVGEPVKVAGGFECVAGWDEAVLLVAVGETSLLAFAHALHGLRMTDKLLSTADPIGTPSERLSLPADGLELAGDIDGAEVALTLRPDGSGAYTAVGFLDGVQIMQYQSSRPVAILSDVLRFLLEVIHPEQEPPVRP